MFFTQHRFGIMAKPLVPSRCFPLCRIHILFGTGHLAHRHGSSFEQYLYFVVRCHE